MRPAPSLLLSCREIRIRIAAYTQGELSLSSAQQVYAHLSQCDSCRETAGTLGSQQTQTRNLGSLTLRAGALATVGAALFFLYYGIYLPNLSTTPAVAYSHEIPVSNTGFAGRAGAAYYVRLHVTDRAAAEETISRILAHTPVLQAKGPYAARYWITATPEQLATLMRRLAATGDPGAVLVENRPWWFEDPSTPNACPVMLDLIPA